MVRSGPLPISLALSAAVFVAAFLSCAVPAASQDPAAVAETNADERSGEAFGSAETCLLCHNASPVNLVLRTPHAQTGDPRTPFAGRGCEECHGPARAHVESVVRGGGLVPPPVVFGASSPTPVADQNKVCLACHQGGLRMNWAGSPHSSADVPCAACHDVHTRKDGVLERASQAKVCFDCHREQQAQAHKRSRHPILEGKVVCSNCHNPHGSFGPKLLVKATVNETCYGCHQEKRGPFLWEHAPVGDDCTLCHDPHGSAQPRMLKVRTPYLCQTCHSEAFHPSTLRSGTALPGGGADSSRLLAKGCLNCHPMVHGTNHPSGPRLTR